MFLKCLGYPVAQIFDSTLAAPFNRQKWRATATKKWDFSQETWSHWVLTWHPKSGAWLYINGTFWAHDASPEVTLEYAKDTLFIGELAAYFMDQTCHKSIN